MTGAPAATASSTAARTPMGPAPAVAAPQWRIDTDRRAAARTALAAGADQLHLDYGGAHRGPPLSDPVALRAAEAVTRRLPVPVLAVNHLNDIGLAHEKGVPNPAAVELLRHAADCALRLGVAVLHVPGFRRSLPHGAGIRAGTVEALRGVCAQLAGTDLLVAYESPLDARESLALARAVDHPALRLVLDTGNLCDAGLRPLDFAEAVAAAGLLLPFVHVKDGSGTTAPSAGDLPALLRASGARSVLVENDYRHTPARLREDIALCRRAADPRPPEEAPFKDAP
ncbi:sugar phosphate isomerase/epimerase [Streptomyces sp. SAI-135]|uniref:sugar phosphate isomerase/epimerase family protein n=1 Tax=unclassified Streptomyces TaxID=2593676 RepID=UPI002474FFE8|nr:MULTISPECIES: TIM barrel protein [unclassified Streptomyces]MDH6515725.1 sugar phosphate isomerase/epimerase [Streptomyces sp. SAI-090]MDH6588036.1 sugar phosphate isomerase/epimerase [Streptomyces sp. SAI-133]MDH6620190.1 sugar phosphate isomerase/epimerase [Streptomyces sp. SAI-135]